MLSRLAETLKTLRKRRGLTQATLAKLCGCNLSTISKLESDRYDAFPKKDLLTKLAAALQVDVDTFVLLSGQFPNDYRLDVASTIVDLAESAHVSPSTFLEILSVYDVEVKLTARKRGAKRTVRAEISNGND